MWPLHGIAEELIDSAAWKVTEGKFVTGGAVLAPGGGATSSMVVSPLTAVLRVFILFSMCANSRSVCGIAN